MHGIRRIWIVAALVAWSSCGAAESAGSAAPPHGVVPMAPMHGQMMQKVWGDPDKPGEAFVTRIHADAGYVVLPHVHPVDENIAVLQGEWALGMGEHFDSAALQPMSAGAFGFAAKNMPHFAYSKTDSVLQVHGVGVFFAKLVDPAYEINEQGMFLLTFLLKPGQATGSVPAECFAWKVGDRVVAPDASGTVKAARCSPANKLTQYWIERADGTRFWARAEQIRAAAASRP